MSGYSESALQKKLAELKVSAPSIQGVALWIMHHKKHYRATVRTWHRQLVAATNSHKLALLYLANDVVQNARKKQPEIEAEFGQVMPRIFLHLSSCPLESATQEKLSRLVAVWRERAIFDKKVHIEVDRVWGKKGQGASPAKRARVEEVKRSVEEEQEAGGDEEELVSALNCVQQLAREQEAALGRLQGGLQEGQEQVVQECVARLQEEVQERRRLGEMLADMVRRQQEQLLQAETRLAELQEKQASLHRQAAARVQEHQDQEQIRDLEAEREQVQELEEELEELQEQEVVTFKDSVAPAALVQADMPVL